MLCRRVAMPQGRINRLDFGPGYRVYFGQKGTEIHLLLGGSKQGQDADIRRAIRLWRKHE